MPFPPDHFARELLLGEPRSPDCLNVLSEARVPELGCRKRLPQCVQDGAQFRLRRVVVASVVEQVDVAAREGLHLLEELADLLDGMADIDFAPCLGLPIVLKTKSTGVAVASALVDCEHLAAVRCRPAVLAAEVVNFVTVPTRVDERVDPGLSEDLRHLRYMPEGIGHIADLLHTTETIAHPMPNDEVADGRFAAHQEFVGQDVPWSDGEHASVDESPDAVLVLRMDGEIVLQNDRLPVE